MRTKYFLPGLLLAVLILGGCLQSADSPTPAVAVVDSSRVFRESEPGKAGIGHLEKLHESMQAELGELQKQLQTTPDDAALQQKLQEKYLAYQERIGAEQQQVINVLNEHIQKALDTCRTQKKLTLVLGTDAVLSYAPVADITDAVIAELNKAKVEFSAIEPEQAENTTPLASPSQNATTPSQNATAPAAK